MKSLEFRAYDKFNDCYIYSEDYKNLGVFFTEVQKLIDAGNGVEVERYTGAEDNQGNKIFEGDIVRYDDGSGEYDDDDIFGVVLFYNCRFLVKIDYECVETIQLVGSNTSLEVLGNIHQKPELLDKN